MLIQTYQLNEFQIFNLQTFRIFEDNEESMKSKINETSPVQSKQSKLMTNNNVTKHSKRLYIPSLYLSFISK